MRREISRRALLTGMAAFGLGQAALAKAPLQSLRPAPRRDDLLKKAQPTLTRVVADARVAGRTSAQVADVATGTVLESHRADVALPPASVAKAITAAYALAVLGPEFRFETRVFSTAPIVDGRLDGDLILAGGGDPTLDTDALAGLARSLREEAGLTELRGRFLIWDGALPSIRTIDPEQPPQVGYSPAVSGLNLNYNRVHFEWRQASGGYDVSMEARAAGFRPEVRSARMRVEPRDHPVYTYEDQGSFDDWTVARSALGKAGARWLPVRKPALYAAEVFQTLARSNGIVLKPAERTDAPGADAVELARHESAPMREILRDMLTYSTNITAECVGMTASKARGGAVTSLAASAAEMNAWAMEDLGMAAPAFRDHSGLGGDSRISAQDMVAGLLAARKSLELKALLKDHPLRDEQRRIIEDHPLAVSAKTGTLNFVSGLGGFIDLPDGTELVFAVFSADLDRRDALSRAERERPPGGRAYNTRARMLQQDLIVRWGILYNG